VACKPIPGDEHRLQLLLQLSAVDVVRDTTKFQQLALAPEQNFKDDEDVPRARLLRSEKRARGAVVRRRNSRQ